MIVVVRVVLVMVVVVMVIVLTGAVRHVNRCCGLCLSFCCGAGGEVGGVNLLGCVCVKGC